MEVYFQIDQRNDGGPWIYSVDLCFEEFRAQFPDKEFNNLILSSGFNGSKTTIKICVRIACS